MLHWQTFFAARVPSNVKVLSMADLALENEDWDHDSVDEDRPEKKKFLAEPVAAMAAGGRPVAGGDGRQVPKAGPKAGPSLELNPSIPFEKPLEVQ